MTDFKWRHYQGQIILGCVRWYCKYGISYRDFEDMMYECGFDFFFLIFYRLVQQ